eukprot:gene24160-30472_t
MGSRGANTADGSSHGFTQHEQVEETGGIGMIEMEERRIEALRRRQEKELSKIVEREQTLAALQQKIKRAEDEEIKKKRNLEREEAEKKREMERREAEVEEKIKKSRLLMERTLTKEAREKDEERKIKMEEYKAKTEALIKLQEDQAERNRLDMLEREQRIMAQLEAKKEAKREEVQTNREKATKRIEEALEKHHEMHEMKKKEFNEHQKEAERRAKEQAIQERERLKKQADDRDKRNNVRMGRLIDSFKTRTEKREDIVERRNEKDQVYDRVKEERDQQIAMMKFQSDLKLQDKLDNVERVARMNEFKRLQTLQRIYTQDHKYEEIKQTRSEMLNKHNEEAKVSLIRKHEIGDAMERMRMTNDFTLLDKLFVNKKKDKKPSTSKADQDGTDLGDDPRLAQTM